MYNVNFYLVQIADILVKWKRANWKVSSSSFKARALIFCLVWGCLVAIALQTTNGPAAAPVAPVAPAPAQAASASASAPAVGAATGAPAAGRLNEKQQKQQIMYQTFHRNLSKLSEIITTVKQARLTIRKSNNVSCEVVCIFRAVIRSGSVKYFNK